MENEKNATGDRSPEVVESVETIKNHELNAMRNLMYASALVGGVLAASAEQAQAQGFEFANEHIETAECLAAADRAAYVAYEENIGSTLRELSTNKTEVIEAQEIVKETNYSQESREKLAEAEAEYTDSRSDLSDIRNQLYGLQSMCETAQQHWQLELSKAEYTGDSLKADNIQVIVGRISESQELLEQLNQSTR